MHASRAGRGPIFDPRILSNILGGPSVPEVLDTTGCSSSTRNPQLSTDRKTSGYALASGSKYSTTIQFAYLGV